MFLEFKKQIYSIYSIKTIWLPYNSVNTSPISVKYNDMELFRYQLIIGRIACCLPVRQAGVTHLCSSTFGSESLSHLILQALFYLKTKVWLCHRFPKKYRDYLYNLLCLPQVLLLNNHPTMQIQSPPFYNRL